MNTTTLSFTITLIAGLATVLGIIPIFFKKKRQDQTIAAALAFSSGIMLTISLISLIPEATSLINESFLKLPALLISAIFIVLGISISTIVDSKIEKKLSASNLYKLGLISAIVLILHNIPEGITTYASTTTNERLGLKLSLAIALHNIPEGISIAIPIYYSTKSKKQAFFYTLIAGFSEFSGAILAHIFLKDILNSFILGLILSITAGIMIDISIYEFLPNALQIKKNKAIVYYFVLGILIMFFSEMFLF